MNERIYFLWALFFVAFGIELTRMVYTQIFRHQFYLRQANKQHNVSVVLPARRGVITDRNRHILAFDIPSFSLYANPRLIPETKKDEFAEQLAKVLDVDKKTLLKKLWKDKAFVWIKRGLPLEKRIEINNLGIKGLGWVQEYSRFYPDGKLASQVIGFTNIDRKGMAGIELFYDSFLRGQDGKMILVRDGRMVKIPLENDNYLFPRDGLNIELTIDEVIQNITEDALDWMMDKFHPSSAWAVVMDPFTGEILAMASRPTYDPNYYYKSDPECMRNRAISDMFEPGSVFKIITASAALEEGVVREDTKIFCENGAYKVHSHILHDYHPYGELTFREVIEKSSNIGTVKVAQMLGKEKLYDYIVRFGFGQKTGIDLPGEIPGSLRPLEKWSKLSISAIPMGQEIGVTAIQLACAVSVIANGGYWVQPYVAKEVFDSKGVRLKDLTRGKKRIRVISPETASRIKSIMVGVVDRGTGRRAKIKGFKVAGKTGTAQRVIDGHYSNIYFTSSFVGFVPAEEPQVVIVVSALTKKPFHFGGVVSAPTFKRIAENVLNYLGIAPPAVVHSDDGQT